MDLFGIGIAVVSRQLVTPGGDMNPVATLLGSQKSDPQAVKKWAAEDFAISIGLLRECPYHGQPFKAKPSM